ncbi:structural maintenance of chromosomes protein 6 [Nematocida sp. AWRm77]|nr:structural maintenance of chromosomes protein 6 [Nematocida sp. AWRm77]
MQDTDKCFLRSIQLINFMCHRNLLVEFTKKLTCIVGSNGSGKSAIMIGLGVLFGVKTSAMDRGASVKKLIKTGEDFAVLRAKITNTDYRCDVFGKTLVVEKRLLLEGAATLKIISENGKVIGRTQEDLVMLLEHFRLSLGNPVCFLTQDQSKKLLRAATPKTLYSFFKTGVDLEDTEAIHKQNTEAVQSMQQSVLAAQKKITGMEKTLGSLSAALSARKSYAHIEEKISTLEVEKAWAEFNAKEQEKYAAEQKKEQYYAQYAEKAAHKEKVLKEIEQVQKAQAALSTEKINSQLQRQHQEEELAEKLSRERKRKKEIEREIEHYAAELAKYQKHQSRLERIIGEKDPTQRENSLESLESLKQALQAEAEQLEVEETEAEKRKQDLQNGLSAATVEIQRTQQAHAKKEEAIRAAQQFTPMAFYGPRMEAALEKIKHQKIPCTGPIGLYLTLKDEKWARAVEAALGLSLFGFIVHTEKDMHALELVFRSTGVAKYRIYLAKEQKQPAQGASVLERARAESLRLLSHAQAHASAQASVAENSLSTVLVQVEGSPALVVEQLIIVLNIDRLGLVSNRHAGYSVLQKSSSFEALFTPEADRIQYIGKSLSDMRCILKDKRLLASKGRLRELEKEMQELREGKKKLQEKQAALEKEHADASRAAHALREKKVFAKKSAQDIVEDIRKKQESQEDEIALEKAQVVEKKKQTELQARSIAETHKDVSAVLDALEKEQQEKKESLEYLAGQEDSVYKKKQKDLQAQKDVLQSTLKKEESDLGRLKEKITEIEKAVDRADLECIRLREASLSKSCGRLLEVSTQPQDIEKELCALRAKQAALDTETESTACLERRHAETASKCAQLEKVVSESVHGVQEIERWTKKRIEMREQMRLAMSAQAAASFAELMDKRDYTGSLLFAHEKEELDIRVMITDKSTGNKNSLSGGERSFSSLCFLLGLWPLVSSPLRVLDEFDVFMDGLNRKAAIQLIMEITHTLSSQVILITPLNMIDVPESYCQIVSLKAPSKE